eukprot:c10592_g1_i1.p1 GENE.c10592_g1_i1~~c10592_g1_i1.p1  ORF type:complete len:348 (-),score=86.20 c10592_g1_i1:28-1035(-)
MEKIRHASQAATPQESQTQFQEIIYGDQHRVQVSIDELLSNAKQQQPQLQRVGLLKFVLSHTNKAFEENVINKITPDEKRAEVRRVVLESNWAGVEEFSNHWLGLLLLKIQANSLCAETVRQLIQRESASGSSFSTGFDEMERILIESGCEISQLYHAYYLAYISAVQDATIKEKIEHSPPTDPLCLSHYSVITLDAQGAYVPVVFSVFFVNVLAPILAAFDKCTQQLRGLDATTHTHAPAYTTFLEAYRNGLAESDLTKCEDVWTDVDRKWMGTKGAIQILHDIETGYGDPLRVKATPDFSIRFLDDSFATENVQISEIQVRFLGQHRDTNKQI